jgi:hypothetical protein
VEARAKSGARAFRGSKRHMHSSPSERPISAPMDVPEKRRASKVTGARAPMPTLLGVAPAAPIVSARPQEEAATAEGDVDDAWDALTPAPAPSQHPPPSCVRPRLDHASRPSPPLAAPVPDPLPKHTLDAISIGEEPTLARRRSRAAGIVVAMATVISLVLIGRRLAARDAPVSRPTAAPPPAAAATTSVSVPVPAESPAAPPSAPAASASADPSAPAPSAGSAARAADTSQGRATVPPKPKHSKPPARRKLSTPPRAAH